MKKTTPNKHRERMRQWVQNLANSEGGARIAHEPLERYLRYTRKLLPRVEVFLGTSGWRTAYAGSYRKYKTWEKKLVQETDKGRVDMTWETILGILTFDQVLGKRTGVQLLLPLIWRQPIGRRARRVKS